MHSPDRGLLLAMAVSACAHLVLVVLPFGTATLRQYPPALQVFLPKPVLSENVGPVREELGMQSSPTPSKPSDIVELTPAPEIRRSPAKPESGLPASRDKTQKARLLNPEWFDEAWSLPPQARGNAIVSLDIDASGRIQAIEVEPGGSEFADWIREELPKRARFLPAQQDGIPVGSTVRIKLDLEPLLR